MNKICITFAGAVGSSKTPIANYLSYKLNLPIFNNDAIRTEVIEDFSIFNKDEYLNRRNARGKEIIGNGKSFIYDASVDREWKQLKEWLDEANYKYFIISLDLSPDFLKKLYAAKQYNESLERIDQIISDHENFIKNHSDKIALHIDDSTFYDRLEMSYRAAKQFFNQ